jgi:hypothetical protein
MPKGQGQGRAQKAANAARTKRYPGEQRVKEIGEASAQIVKQATAILDEEFAAGIITARKMQDRFQKERRIDPADFKAALQRFQADGHDVVNLLSDQIEELRSEDNAQLASRLLSNTHDMLDLVVGFVNMGAEIANQLIQNTTPNQDAEQRKTSK